MFLVSPSDCLTLRKTSEGISTCLERRHGRRSRPPTYWRDCLGVVADCAVRHDTAGTCPAGGVLLQLKFAYSLGAGCHHQIEEVMEALFGEDVHGKPHARAIGRLVCLSDLRARVHRTHRMQMSTLPGRGSPEKVESNGRSEVVASGRSALPISLMS